MATLENVGKKFIFGVEKTPEWFTNECLSGRAKVNYNEETGEIENAIIYSPTKRFYANKGDVIMMMKSGMTVIQRDKAKKYKVIEE